MTKHQKLMLQRHIKASIRYYRMMLSSAELGSGINSQHYDEALSEATETLEMLNTMPTSD